MTYSLYKKPYQTPVALVSYMKNKGLIITDDDAAELFLRTINYYRFKVYLLPYIEPNSDQYIEGSKFTEGVQLYRFDDELRDILFSVIGRIEIKLRTRLDQVITEHTNNPFWYLRDELFSNVGSINVFRFKLASSFQGSRDTFSAHYKANYFNDEHDDYKQLPPFWLLAELTTFGNIKMLYKALNKQSFRGDNNSNALDVLAHEFGAKNLVELNSWIDLMNDVRNRCAHHSRVWNSNYRAAKGVANFLSAESNPARNNRIYLFIVMLQKIDMNLNMDIQIKTKMNQLFLKYPAAKSKSYSAGFPEHWEKDPFWAVVK